jgi:hypothetical protein
MGTLQTLMALKDGSRLQHFATGAANMAAINLMANCDSESTRVHNNQQGDGKGKGSDEDNRDSDSNGDGNGDGNKGNNNSNEGNGDKDDGNQGKDSGSNDIKRQQRQCRVTQ